MHDAKEDDHEICAIRKEGNMGRANAWMHGCALEFVKKKDDSPNVTSVNKLGNNNKNANVKIGEYHGNPPA